MINAEKYKKDLRAVNRNTAYYERWGVNKKTNSFVPCGCLFCKDCVMYDLKDNKDEKNYVGCNHARITWMLSEYVEPIKLTETEYTILKFLADNTKHMYIARDRKGSLYLYDIEPRKSDTEDWWIGHGATQFIPFNKLFKFITWEDGKAYSIKEILKHCHVLGNTVIVHEVGGSGFKVAEDE